MAALGYAGLLPFYACAIWMWVPDAEGRALAGKVFIVYGAVILAFLGGTLWGYAVSLPPPGKLWRLALSNLVALFAAVAALVTPVMSSVLLLALGQVGLLVYERSCAVRQSWYLRLRTRLVIAVLPAHALLLAASPAAAAEAVVYERDGQVLEIELRSGLAAPRREEVVSWIRDTADALALVYGRWPRQRWRVQVSTYDAGGRDPVPWGQVNRGDPDVVSFYIDPSASRRQLASDWTAFHEFSHLLIPYRGWGDMWFSEGLASYYQNLLQARHGTFDEREMWQRLHDGFMRGRDNRRPDLSLAELSPRMRESRSFMRVYWSGAWYFFRADVELRRRSDGRQSLDTALAALNACCADASLSARRIAEELDRVTGQSLFVPLFEQVAESRALPPFEQEFEALGISVAGGNVSLDEAHPAAGIRQGFARPPL